MNVVHVVEFFSRLSVLVVMVFCVCVISVGDRALGDKSELPLLAVTSPLTMLSFDSNDTDDTGIQNGAFESQLSELAISTVAGTDNGQEVVNLSTGVECDNATSDVNQSESVADPDMAAEDGAVAVAESNCEASAEPVSQSDDVGSDAKGEVKQLLRHINPSLVFSCLLTCHHFCFLSVFFFSHAYNLLEIFLVASNI